LFLKFVSYVTQGSAEMFRLIQTWWQVVLIRFRVHGIASAALRETWGKVRAKTVGLPKLQSVEYISRHSAAVVHRKVELLVRKNPKIDGGTANILIVKASNRLSRQLLRKLACESRTLRRAAFPF